MAAGPCGAAGLAALRLVLLGVGSEDRRAHLRLQPDSTVILVVTEGAAANPVPDLEDS